MIFFAPFVIPKKFMIYFGRFRNVRIKKAMGQIGHIGVTNVTQIFCHYLNYTIIIGESQIQNVTDITKIYVKDLTN